MNQKFTFKGFNASFDLGKHEKGQVKIEEISFEVTDLNLKEYAELIVKIPSIVKELTNVVLDAKQRDAEFERQIANETYRTAQSNHQASDDTFSDDDDDDFFPKQKPVDVTGLTKEEKERQAQLEEDKKDPLYCAPGEKHEDDFIDD